MPAAPRSRARAASSGASMLASSRISTPSSVTAGRSRILVERLLVGLPAPLPRLDLRERLGVGLDEDLARRAVDRDERARRDEGAGVVQAGDGRHVQRAREDRGVIRPAAGIGDEPREPLPVELRDDRRRHLVGDQHQRTLEVA